MPPSPFLPGWSGWSPVQGADRNSPVHSLFQAFLLAASVSFLLGCWFLVKAKGRSGWWVLAPMLLQIIGLIVILGLQDRAKQSSIPAEQRLG